MVLTLRQWVRKISDCNIPEVRILWDYFLKTPRINLKMLKITFGIVERHGLEMKKLVNSESYLKLHNYNEITILSAQ